MSKSSRPKLSTQQGAASGAPTALSTKARQRLDVALVERGLVASREQARARVLAGDVLVDGQVAAKPGVLVAAGAALELRAAPAYVSRGGDKLAHALARF